MPAGALSLALVAAFVDEPPALVGERMALWRRGLRVDWVGFILVALALGFLEIVLDKGQEDDWFKSTFIVTDRCQLHGRNSPFAFVGSGHLGELWKLFEAEFVQIDNLCEILHPQVEDVDW